MMVYEGDSHGLACVELKINDTFDAKIETYYREPFIYAEYSLRKAN